MCDLIKFVTRAYKSAYPNITKQRTAETAGNRLLRNVEVREYIQKRLDEKEAALIAKRVKSCPLFVRY